MTESITLTVAGMTCDACATHVKEALEKVPGVRSAQVSYPKGVATLTADRGTSQEALTDVVTGLGYRISLDSTSSSSTGSRSLSKGIARLGSGDGGSLHIAVIGSGGAAMGGSAEGS